MKAVLALVFWLAIPSLGFSQVLPVYPDLTLTAAAPAVAPAAGVSSLLASLTDGTFLAGMMVVFGAMLAFLRGLAEALTRLSTRYPGVSKSAQAVSSAAWILGAFIGKWGHGEPALVSQEKAKAFAEKGVLHAGSAATAEPPKAG